MKLWQVHITEPTQFGTRRTPFVHDYVVMAESDADAQRLALEEHAHGIPEFLARVTRITVEDWDGATVKLGMRKARP